MAQKGASLGGFSLEEFQPKKRVCVGGGVFRDNDSMCCPLLPAQKAPFLNKSAGGYSL